MSGLILAGTQEARQLCEKLAKNHVKATASLAGATRSPANLALPTRTGGFGGEQGFSQYLKAENIEWVIDATHPFANIMTATAAKACQAAKIPYLILQRPEWTAASDDKWHMIETISDLPALIPAGTHVFLGTGRQTLPDFTCLADRKLLCRVIDDPVGDFPFKGGKFLQGRPPFSMQEEIDLFTAENIDWLVVKNSGGTGGFSKLLAARAMGLPVAMLNRVALPKADRADTVEEAMKWLMGKLA